MPQSQPEQLVATERATLGDVKERESTIGRGPGDGVSGGASVLFQKCHGDSDLCVGTSAFSHALLMVAIGFTSARYNWIFGGLNTMGDFSSEPNSTYWVIFFYWVIFWRDLLKSNPLIDLFSTLLNIGKNSRYPLCNKRRLATFPAPLPSCRHVRQVQHSGQSSPNLQSSPHHTKQAKSYSKQPKSYVCEHIFECPNNNNNNNNAVLLCRFCADVVSAVCW